MRILFVSATFQELLPFIDRYNLKNIIKDKFYSGSFGNYEIDLLVTGIGMVATAYQLTKTIYSNKYDLVINAGIAGSFKREIPIGEVVEVIEDCFSELGAEDGDLFIPFNKMKMKSLGTVSDYENKIINHSTLLFKNRLFLKTGKGITVNTVHGNERSIVQIIKSIDPDIETMEGAAFMYICSTEGLKYLQLRSISNYVEKRNKEKWNISLAVQNLNNTLFSMIEKEII